METDTSYLGEEIKEDVFSFRVSIKARWREIRYSISLLRKSPLFVIGFVVISTLVLMALLAPVITSYAPKEFDLRYRNLPPMTTDTSTELKWSGYVGKTQDFGLDPNLKIRTWAADLTNDTRNDFIVGTSEPSLLFYESTGKVEDTNFQLVENYFNISLPVGVTRVVPTSGDIDGDKDIDLIIGCDDGKVYISKNEGTFETPLWSDFEALRDSGNNELTFPGQANPTLFEYNNDSMELLDLIIGSEADNVTNKHKIFVYINSGNTTHYRFTLNPNMPKNLLGQPLEIATTPVVDDSMRVFFGLIDNNTRQDMIVIFDSGAFEYYLVTDMLINPTFIEVDKDEPSVTFEFPELAEEPFLDFQWNDFSKDNKSDIVIFFNNGTVIANFQYYEVDGRLHILGTDEQGGDIFSRCIWALQTDFFLAIWVVSIATVIGTIIGGFAGYFGGWVDNLMMRITDIFFAFPGLILAMSIAAALGPSLFNLSLALIIVWWSGYARIARGQVISEKNRLYVEAARSVGMGDMRILFRHILPNSIYPLLVAATLDLGGVVLTAAGLSFIGFGAQPGDAELGIMIASGREFFLSKPWLVFFPGVFIFLIVLAFNLVGDGIRDVMDPKLRR